jgi:thiosulfate dehydrogenase [quinone] large subunit
MLALLGIGVALIVGFMVRIASVGGALLLLLMYLAEWPLNAVDPETGLNTANNPIIDDHIIYAVAMIMLMLFTAERTVGLGRIWQSTHLVQRFPWLA